MVGDGVYLASGSGRGSFMPTLLGMGFVSGSWGEGLVVEEGGIGGKSVGESRSKGGESCTGLLIKKDWGVMSGGRICGRWRHVVWGCGCCVSRGDVVFGWTSLLWL